MKKFGIFLTLAAFIICLFAVPVLTLKREKADYSIYENRALATFPQFTSELLFNGWYTQAWENYLTDHMVGRNSMLAAYTDMQLNLLKKPVVNDVVVSGDVLLPFFEYAIPDLEKQSADIAAMANELEALNAHIKANGGTFLYVGVDEQPYALSHLYPEYFNKNAHLISGAREFFSALEAKGVPYIDMRQEFGDNVQEYYSKVDHHFNFKGAYFTYEKICQRLDLKPAELIFREVEKPFYGSRNRKLYNAFPSDEKLMIGEPVEPVHFSRSDNGSTVYPAVYNIPPDEDEPITYAAYMAADVAETVISTGRKNLPNILIFGDSFTNPIESVLYLNSNRMHSLDLRHYTEMTLFEYIQKHKPDIVICVRDNTNYWTADGNGTFR